MGWWSSGSSRPSSDSEDSRHRHNPSNNKEEEEKPQLPSLSSRTSSSSSKQTIDWNSSLNAFDWSQFTEPRNLIPTLLLTGGILFAVHIHRRYLRRFPEATDITSSHFRQRSLLGHVTSVGDGDNFRMYHTPGGRLVGWGWLPWMKVPTSRKELKDRTVSVFPHTKRERERELYQWLCLYRSTSVLPELTPPSSLISADQLNHIPTKHTSGLQAIYKTDESAHTSIDRTSTSA